MKSKYPYAPFILCSLVQLCVAAYCDEDLHFGYLKVKSLKQCGFSSCQG